MPYLSCRNWRPAGSSKPDGECLARPSLTELWSALDPHSPAFRGEGGIDGGLCKLPSLQGEQSTLKPHVAQRDSSLNVVTVVKGTPGFTPGGSLASPSICVPSCLFASGLSFPPPCAVRRRPRGHCCASTDLPAPLADSSCHLCSPLPWSPPRASVCTWALWGDLSEWAWNPHSPKCVCPFCVVKG